MQDTLKSHPKHITTLRWFARIIGTFGLLWLLLNLYVIMELFISLVKKNLPLSFLFTEMPPFVTGTVIVISLGLLAGWKWDGLASGLIITGCFAHLFSSGSFSLFPYIFIGFIYFYCWQHSKESLSIRRKSSTLFSIKEQFQRLVTFAKDILKFTAIGIGKILINMLVTIGLVGAVILILIQVYWVNVDPPRLTFTDLPTFTKAEKITSKQLADIPQINEQVQAHEKYCAGVVNKKNFDDCRYEVYKVGKATSWFDILKFYEPFLSRNYFHVVGYDKVGDLFPFRVSRRAVYERKSLWIYPLQFEGQLLFLDFSVPDESDYDLLWVTVTYSWYPK